MWHVVCTIDNFEEGVAEMKRLVAASAVALLITILATPSFARGPGWGRRSGYCWQTDRGYGNFAPEQRKGLDQAARQNYEQFAPNAPLSGWFGRGFGRHMRSYGPNHGTGNYALGPHNGTHDGS